MGKYSITRRIQIYKQAIHDWEGGCLELGLCPYFEKKNIRMDDLPELSEIYQKEIQKVHPFPNRFQNYSQFLGVAGFGGFWFSIGDWRSRVSLLEKAHALAKCRLPMINMASILQKMGKAAHEASVSFGATHIGKHKKERSMFKMKKRFRILQETLQDFKTEQEAIMAEQRPLDSDYFGICIYLRKKGYLPNQSGWSQPGQPLIWLVKNFPELGKAYTVLTANPDPTNPPASITQPASLYWFQPSDIESRIRVLERACEILVEEIGNTHKKIKTIWEQEKERELQKLKQKELMAKQLKNNKAHIEMLLRLTAKMIRLNDQEIPFIFELELTRPRGLDISSNDSGWREYLKPEHTDYSISLTLPEPKNQ
jgi:hypothetical protein